MRPLLPNPLLKIVGVVLTITGMILAWRDIEVVASLLIVVGTLVSSIGVDTKLTSGGLKLGFTDLKRCHIKEVRTPSNQEIVIVSHDDRNFRLVRWHYRKSEWPKVQAHLNQFES